MHKEGWFIYEIMVFPGSYTKHMQWSIHGEGSKGKASYDQNRIEPGPRDPKFWVWTRNFQCVFMYAPAMNFRAFERSPGGRFSPVDLLLGSAFSATAVE